jgi:dynein heavy chain
MEDSWPMLEVEQAEMLVD